jgi:hypothetical protein
MKNLSLNDAVDRDIPGSAITFIAAAQPYHEIVIFECKIPTQAMVPNPGLGEPL